jgi:hypothetical protein
MTNTDIMKKNKNAKFQNVLEFKKLKRENSRIQSFHKQPNSRSEHVLLEITVLTVQGSCFETISMLYAGVHVSMHVCIKQSHKQFH